MKARFWKGPFAGKVVECNGQPTLIYRGLKPMTRKQRYEYQREAYQNLNYMSQLTYGGFMFPQIEATYRMCIKRGYSGNEPHTHPDGSIFYEFVEKREI